LPQPRLGRVTPAYSASLARLGSLRARFGRLGGNPLSLLHIGEQAALTLDQAPGRGAGSPHRTRDGAPASRAVRRRDAGAPSRCCWESSSRSDQWSASTGGTMSQPSAPTPPCPTPPPGPVLTQAMYDQHYGSVASSVALYGVPERDVADVVQEVFVQVHRLEGALAPNHFVFAENNQILQECNFVPTRTSFFLSKTSTSTGVQNCFCRKRIQKRKI
jgi:hypothetical protein